MGFQAFLQVSKDGVVEKAALIRTAETAEDLTVFRRVARTFGAESDGYITLLGRRSGAAGCASPARPRSPRPGSARS